MPKRLRLLSSLFALALLAPAPTAAGERESLTAALQDYANILFLTQMFGAPAASPGSREPCVDVLDAPTRAALAEGISELSTLGTWPLRCAPVAAVVTDLPGGRLAARLRYLDILDDGGWIETLKRDISVGRPGIATADGDRLAALFARLPAHLDIRDLDVLVSELIFAPGN